MLAVHLIKTYCLPMPLYSCEIWAARPVDMRSVDVSWNNAFRKIFNTCWRESVKPLQFYCSCLPASVLVHQRRILFWLKMVRSDNVILHTLAGCSRDSVVALLCPRPRRGGGGIRRSSASVVRPSVCLSVRLSDVAYIGSNSKTKRPRKTKLCTGVPQVTCDSHTDFKVKRSKVKVTGRRHIVASTKRAATWRTAADITSLKYYLILQCL